MKYLSDGEQGEYNTLKDEYIKKSNLVNRSFMIIIGLSSILLLFIIIPYYLSLEQLQTLINNKKQFQDQLKLTTNLNNSISLYLNSYNQSIISLQNDFNNMSSKIKNLTLTGNTIYPQCEKYIITGNFYRCNIELMTKSENDQIINAYSGHFFDLFKPILTDWDKDYQPRLLIINQQLNRSYNYIISNADTIKSISEIPKRLFNVTNTYFSKDIPKEIISIYLNTINNNNNKTTSISDINIQAPLEQLVTNITSKNMENENDIQNTTSLVSTITKRIGSVETPLGNITLGFEEILVFSPIVLSVSYLACIFILIETNHLRNNTILNSNTTLNTIKPLIFFSKDRVDRYLRSLPLFIPLIIFIVSSHFVTLIWQIPHVFSTFKSYSLSFNTVYVLLGLILFIAIFIAILSNNKKNNE